MSDTNIFLVGMPAVGKSTIGRLLAKLRCCPFLDSDQEVEARAGADIPWIFDVEGEEGFREREQQVIDDLTQRSGIVLATGGGAVLRTANRRALAGRGTVVLLDSSNERIGERTARDVRRPLFRGAEGRKVIERLRRERLPLYREVADFTFRTDRYTARTIARNILREVTI